jgi:transcriptional regulator with XRE-family HTH domain
MRKHPQTTFGYRLRQAHEALGIPQDKLGVLIGLDEGCSSARISRYETGAHQPPFETAQRLAKALNVPVAYFYCERESIGKLLLKTVGFTDDEVAHLMRTADRIEKDR